MKIAICGKMGSGKSTLAKKLETYDNYYVASFASRVKELAFELFDIVKKDRECLIHLATSLREIDKDVWIKALFKNIPDNYDNIVIDDLRLENEYEFLKKNNWYIVKLEINKEERNNRLFEKYKEDTYNHIKCSDSITENEVCSYPDNKFDLVIKDEPDPYSYLIKHIN